MVTKIKQVDTQGTDPLKEKATFTIEKKVYEDVEYSLEDLYELKSQYDKDVARLSAELSKFQGHLYSVEENIALLEDSLGINNG